MAEQDLTGKRALITGGGLGIGLAIANRFAMAGADVALASRRVDLCQEEAAKIAKAHGVKTGTSVGEARRLCPRLVVVEARPAYYTRLHHAIGEAIDRVLPVDRVYSIDEMACRLSGKQQEPAAAVALARAVKESIRRYAGSTLRCSVGIAPNRFLAKVACDMPAAVSES